MDSAYTKTTYQNRLRLLEASPLLSTLPHGSLDSLARSAELVACSRQHRFYGPHDPVERRIPYLIVHGCVQVLYAEVARRDGTKLLGPGAVFGLEGAVKKTLGEAALDEEAATVNAWAEEPVWLLKLDFKRLKDPRPAIKGLWTRLERSTPRCTAALREFLLLRNLPHHVLQDLAIVSQRFDINEGIGHVKLLASTQPRSMLVVGGDLEADCLTGEEHEEPVTLRGGPGDLLALPPGARALKWIRSSASFLLSRTSELEKMAREVRPLHWAMARASGRNTADIILAMPDRRLEMDLACVRQLVRRLAAGMHDHVGDRATVVSLVEDTGLTVEEGQLPVDPHDLAASMAGAITEFWNKAQGPQPDVLLVDPTPLLGDRVKDLHVVRQLGFGIERVAEETPAGVVTSISYLFDQPGVWAEAWVDMGMPRETHFLPTVLLDPDPTDGTLAPFLADARDDFDR